MKIELVVTRDPDSADEVDIFIDGVPVDKTDIVVEEFHIDAGAGRHWDDWIDSRAENVARASGPVASILRELALDPPGGEYIEDMPDDEDERELEFERAMRAYKRTYAKQAACLHSVHNRVTDWYGQACGSCDKRLPWLPHAFKQREDTPHSYCETCKHSEEGGNHE